MVTEVMIKAHEGMVKKLQECEYTVFADKIFDDNNSEFTDGERFAFLVASLSRDLKDKKVLEEYAKEIEETKQYLKRKKV